MTNSLSEKDGNTSYTKSSSYPNRYTVTFDSELPKTSEGTAVPLQKYKWTNHHGTGKYMFVYADTPYTTSEISQTHYKTQYRYRDRSLIYTYYFYKDENKESATYPSGNNISNVKEWVQYRPKVWNCSLDVNYYVDGLPYWGGQPQAITFDVYINGVRVADDVYDFVDYYTVGTTYEIKDLRVTNGYNYLGVVEGELSGTLKGLKRVWLSFSKK